MTALPRICKVLHSLPGPFLARFHNLGTSKSPELAQMKLEASLGIVLKGKTCVFVFSSEIGKSVATAREGSGIVESTWSPNHPTRRFGVHLASTLGDCKSFVFSEGCL